MAIAQLFKLPELSEDDLEDNGSNLAKLLGSTGLGQTYLSTPDSSTNRLESLEKL